MGGKSSKGSSGRHIPSSSSWNQYGYPQASPYPYQSPQQNQYYMPQHHQPSTSYSYEAERPQPQRRLDRKYSRISDDYKTLDQVTAALAQSGLESSNLIVGIDFTKSNEWTGARSFNRRSLHHIGNGQNPYEQAISIIGRTLSAFDEDNLIPCFGFGDASTHDQDVFSFHQDEKFCNGFEEVLTRYREIVPQLRLAGPTSFAPIIDMAITIVEQSGGQYHVLLIIADGQVTRSVDTQHGQLSPQEKKTIDAIVKASEYPLSIILVGVGDGPWDMMREFDDNIPARAFDNFQFVNFTEIMSKNVNESRKETEFALAALMEIPAQYKATIELGLLGRRSGNASERVPLPPPLRGPSSFSNSGKTSRSSSFQQRVPSYSGYDSSVPSYSGYDSPVSGYDTPVNTAPYSSSTSTYDNQVCPICLTNRKDMAFGCGHQTCCECGEDLQSCPICRSSINTRIRLY
ncbi:E3 ubiquitin-protein ligase RGLG2 isoform X2 [Manihot esculenta]|uniref:Uncharacterized protein n=4 Tax=Manihot esculenta TaxID=3983 RepID=A0ACB7GJL7_MANES|nr:E3 ubiquitin-protein ligase RGLG2 isoform X2 [Manihot esculenta]KAG8640072.1 hypothetical protein MANES_13G021000v8 [Manihot esculenta]KAG8640073.1 hypothetical protein MANES_13G021000v8 [Manihot esculenta]KAG8640074.1 hypothetical protein MANES_13G021000v8 [Manihot esculenta]OAY32478.1 hypothetical protein MANES_13G021000v8 [Manihot esculenta]